MISPLPDGDDPALIGIQAVKLTRLARVEGATVPPYYLIATPILETVIASLDHATQATLATLERLPPDAVELPALARVVQNRLLNAELPAGLRDAMANAYQAFSQRLGLVAAPVILLDSPTDGPRREEYVSEPGSPLLGEAAVLQAIRAHWAAYWSPAALRQRHPHRTAAGAAGLAIIVQHWIAGVPGPHASRDPVTGDPMRRPEVSPDRAGSSAPPGHPGGGA